MGGRIRVGGALGGRFGTARGRYGWLTMRVEMVWLGQEGYLASTTARGR